MLRIFRQQLQRHQSAHRSGRRHGTPPDDVGERAPRSIQNSKLRLLPTHDDWRIQLSRSRNSSELLRASHPSTRKAAEGGRRPYSTSQQRCADLTISSERTASALARFKARHPLRAAGQSWKLTRHMGQHAAARHICKCAQFRSSRKGQRFEHSIYLPLPVRQAWRRRWRSPCVARLVTP